MQKSSDATSVELIIGADLKARDRSKSQYNEIFSQREKTDSICANCT